MVIPARRRLGNTVQAEERPKLRVAAYCRVSTDSDEQATSYEAQVEYYTSKISENENWKNAGIYADDGKSGTNTKKRADFNAMIQDALAGKIDMILTKSVSRFARNTVDSLVTIRKLKEKNVAVVFEKEGINTLEGTGEILITILSSLAQEESRNISENIRWGVVRKFEKGKVIVNCTKFMGYTKNEDGDLVIVPEEAEIVKLIFRLYLEGYSTGKIAKHLEEQGIKTATSVWVITQKCVSSNWLITMRTWLSQLLRKLLVLVVLRNLLLQLKHLLKLQKLLQRKPLKLNNSVRYYILKAGLNVRLFLFLYSYISLPLCFGMSALIKYGWGSLHFDGGYVGYTSAY